ncbi:MAG: Holliday junction resolvase RuvX [Brevinema sp.]
MARILGIDYGTKKIGLALTDELRIIASPHSTQTNNENFWNFIKTLIIDQHIDGFVVGIPVHQEKNSFEPHVLGFIRKLQRTFNLPIYLQDESLSSRESRDFLLSTGKRGKKLSKSLDQYAAQKILSEFLQSLEQGKFVLFNEEK